MTTLIKSTNSLQLDPVLEAHGTVALPGSKSISNRVLLLAALASGSTTLRGLLDSDDTKVMLKALTSLGVSYERINETDDYIVHGVNGKFNKTTQLIKLLLGNAGSAVRPLTAVLALIGDGTYLLEGVARMHERPIGDLVDGLRQLGCEIEYKGQDGFPPLKISTPSLRIAKEPIVVKGDVSSQFLSALLMALPLIANRYNTDIVIEVSGELISQPYVEITLNLLKRFGVVIDRDGWKSFTISKRSIYASPKEIFVEGDASSASYFLAAGVIGGGPVRVTGVGKSSIQGDIKFADALQQMGATIKFGENWIEASHAGVAGKSNLLKAIDLDCNHIPDAAMTLAVLALYADGATTLRNIGSWRVKETDRISAMAAELRKIGAHVNEGIDFLTISPPDCPADWHSASIHTYDDHRMAMCFSLASFNSYGADIEIEDPSCVNKTFPNYFKEFDSVTTARC
jgi:3-phosphoshikimate 1-carboxyvinyltransferase